MPGSPAQNLSNLGTPLAFVARCIAWRERRVTLRLMNKMSLYDRIGGSEKLKILVSAFYERVQQDSVLAPFFKDVQLDKLQAMQAEFFTMALGGPVEYSGKSLVAAHHHRGIKPEHMTRFVGCLMATLEDQGLSKEDTLEIIDRINRRSNEVLGVSY